MSIYCHGQSLDTITTLRFNAEMLNLAGAVAVAVAIAMQAALVPSVLTGAWTGTLEYRDYQRERRVTLPTTLMVEKGEAGALEFSYVYDDGPGKTVRSRERVTIDADKGTWRVQNGDGTYDNTFAARGLADFGPAGGTLELMGKGTENDEPVDLRITITASAGSFTMLRESRRAGSEFQFRNQYKFSKSR
jgi:hypothetical protein